MAVTFDTFAPFDSGAGSSVGEDMWRAFMGHTRDDGVIARRSAPVDTTPDELEVFADATGMQIKVRTGEVWIRGHWGNLTSQKTLPIAAAHATLPRIDRVVARADFVGNTIAVDVLTGTAAASPSAPSLTQNTSAWEIPLAQVRVNPAVVTIEADKVTDERQRRGTGLFNHFSPPLYAEGTFGSLGETSVNLGASGARYCRWFQVGKILQVRYDFRWGPEAEEAQWNGGTGRIFTKLPAGLVAAPTGDHRLPVHLWTHSRDPKGSGSFVDRDWMGTALIPWASSRVFPFMPRSSSDCRITWMRIVHETGGTPVPDVGGTDAFPEGGSLCISGTLEVQ